MVEITQNIPKNIDIHDNNSICRTCLSICDALTPIFARISVFDNEISFSDILSNCASLQIHKSDGYPQNICTKCKENAYRLYTFKLQCEKSQKYLEKRGRIKEETSENQIFLPIKTELEADELSTTKKVEHKEQNIKTKTQAYCCQCQKYFCSSSSLNRHLRLNKQHQAPEVKQEITIENHSISDEAKTNENDNVKSEINTETNEEIDVKLDKPFKCSICPKTFGNKSNLRKHLSVHSNKNHKCDVCGASFNRKDTLTVHQRIHNGAKPLTCKVCFKKFRQYSSLKAHEVVHRADKKFACDKCHLSFIRKESLTVHKKRHLGDGKPYKCTFCGKGFTTNYSKEMHSKAHKGVRDFKCEVCGKEFYRKGELKVHMRVHSGVRPFKCDVCGKGFDRALLLKNHLVYGH